MTYQHENCNCDGPYKVGGKDQHQMHRQISQDEHDDGHQHGGKIQGHGEHMQIGGNRRFWVLVIGILLIV